MRPATWNSTQAPGGTATAGDLAVTASALQNSIDASTNAVMKHLVYSTGQQAALNQQLSAFASMNSSAAASKARTAKARAAREQARVAKAEAANHKALLKWVAEINAQVSISHSVYGCATVHLHAQFPALYWAAL